MRPVLLFLSCLSVLASDSYQFRGPTRDGIFQATGLLKSWPDSGPKLKWSAQGLGRGYSTTAVADGRIFVTGMDQFKGYLNAFDLDGNRLWRKHYGQEHHGGGYPGTRTTPTVDGDRVYIISSMGVVYCFDVKDGSIIWKVNTIRRFAPNTDPDKILPRWSIAESLLIVDDKVICTPGAPNATLAALDKKTGATVWTTKSKKDKSGYCSPRLFEDYGVRQIITMTSQALIGVNPETGELAWRYEDKASWDIHANSPMFYRNHIFVADGYGKGLTAFKFKTLGDGVKKLWKVDALDIHHGGGVVIDGIIYGAGNRGNWLALDAISGKILKHGRGVGKGSVVYADGLLYAYGEKGIFGLIDPKGPDLNVTSRFRITQGQGQHWAHPTIAHKTLYVRHGDVLLAYDIAE